MLRVSNIFLLISIVAATILSTTGYYHCNSQQTLHLYSSCCSEEIIVETCCSEPVDYEGDELSGICCDKIEIQSSPLQIFNPVNICDLDTDYSLDDTVTSINPLSSKKLILCYSPSKKPPTA